MSKHRALVPVTFTNGEQKNLRFDMNAIAELEGLLGKSIAFALENEDQLGIKFIRNALYCGLLWANKSKKFTPATVGNMMDPDHMADYGHAVSRGIMLALGIDPDRKREEGEEAPVNPTRPEIAESGILENNKETPTPQVLGPVSSGI